ncbi:DNA translocase FtsK [Patescibacteria group bacterium]|nr:DNA translocase FtsK [Patescibacteria group bacterium]MBU0964536.1 DNA translocase FtsK [Patescibacteria group bacterium]
MQRRTKKDYLKKYKKEARKNIHKETPEEAEQRPRLRSETKNGIIIVVVVTLGIIAALSLFNWAGQLGQAVDTGLKYLFGWGKYIFPLIMFLFGYLFAKQRKLEFRLNTYVGLVFMVASYSALLHLIAVPLDRAVSDIAEGHGGGYFGIILFYPLIKLMGPWAGGVIIVSIFIVSLLITFDISLKKLLSNGGFFRKVPEKFRQFFYKLKVNMDSKGGEVSEMEQSEVTEEKNFDVKSIKQEATMASSEFNEAKPVATDTSLTEKQMALFSAAKKHKRKIDMPIDLLESNNAKPTSGDIEGHKEKIEKTFRNFGIEVEMGEAKVGPTVTQYTLKPAEGVKLSQITTLGNDLALALAAHPIRIEAPIPGQSLVGIEVPNQAVAVVKLKEILMSSEFKKQKSKLTVALGKDVAGKVWTADLDPMPHLLIAGATGSGKSVCLNSILLSLLYQNSPDELKLILVDPKRVEMTAYNGIPHLLTPVVNEVDKTINALRWVVAEMDRRFELLSKTGHRNINAYNFNNGNTMPYLVLAIDELADLMSVASNEVEAAIIRLAQMARAVGIHLILATQRPSVDIITGLIKANITTRIAFSVASLIDSRTILDTSGAEKLVGRGDLLYISSQISKPKRLQGAYVTDQEITRVLDHLKNQAGPEYQEEILEKVIDRTLVGNFEDLADDELLEQAKELVVTAGKASASFLQRRLRIGYARAARLLDILEEGGIIGPGDGAKPREIFIKTDNVDNSEDLSNQPPDDEDMYPQSDEDEVVK